MRVPPTPSVDSLLTPLYRRRSAEGLEAAERRVLTRRSAVGANGSCVALRSAVVLRFSRRVLAPLLAAAAAAWLPPAAKEGQGDCDFPLGPPWILLYPLKRRRSAGGMEAAERCVLARRSALLQRVGMLPCGLPFLCGIFGGVLASLWAAVAALWQPPAAKEG